MDRKIIFANTPNRIANTPMPFSVIGRSRIEGYTHIVQAPIELDIAMFHEMVHWFHHLRNPNRNYIEINFDRSRHFNNVSLSQYYWKNIDYCCNSWNSTKEQNYARVWSTGMPSHLNFEEMRTLLGMPHSSLDQDYLNGDDLSENLYRICKGLLLRFGYTGDCFYEDRKVIDRVINSCINNYVVYITGKDNFINFMYDTGRSGFGKCKIHP